MTTKHLVAAGVGGMLLVVWVAVLVAIGEVVTLRRDVS
jgi:hypothetical protein